MTVKSQFLQPEKLQIILLSLNNRPVFSRCGSRPGKEYLGDPSGCDRLCDSHSLGFHFWDDKRNPDLLAAGG